MDFNTIGKNIKKYRLSNNLRQEDLAEKTGLSVNYIGLVERGKKMPSLPTFIAILNALDASADIVLAELLSNGYKIKESLLSEKMSKIPIDNRKKVYKIIDLFIDD